MAKKGVVRRVVDAVKDEARRVVEKANNSKVEDKKIKAAIDSTKAVRDSAGIRSWIKDAPNRATRSLNPGEFYAPPTGKGKAWVDKTDADFKAEKAMRDSVTTRVKGKKVKP